MFKIGISLHPKQISDEIFAKYKESGIGAVEICVSHGDADLDYDELVRLTDKYGIERWSYHLPFYTADISNPEIADESIKNYCELIDKAVNSGFTHIVVHPCFEVTEEDREERFALAKKNLPIVAEYAKSKGVPVAVEDLPKQCIGRSSWEIKELISTHENLYACFDTNHLFFEKPEDYIRALGDKLITLHVSDYDFIFERHWLPGEGKIDWQALYQALLEVNYSGVWMYEVPFSSKTIIRERNLEPSDYAKNAREIFEGKKPTAIGTPNPEIYANK